MHVRPVFLCPALEIMMQSRRNQEWDLDFIHLWPEAQTDHNCSCAKKKKMLQICHMLYFSLKKKFYHFFNWPFGNVSFCPPWLTRCQTHNIMIPYFKDRFLQQWWLCCQMCLQVIFFHFSQRGKKHDMAGCQRPNYACFMNTTLSQWERMFSIEQNKFLQGQQRLFLVSSQGICKLMELFMCFNVFQGCDINLIDVRHVRYFNHTIHT